jgi:glutathione S-transferase
MPSFLRKPLGLLNDAFAGRNYLAGNNFTVVDLNVASILVWGKMGRLNLSGYTDVTRWFDTCLARPAYGRVRKAVNDRRCLRYRNVPIHLGPSASSLRCRCASGLK